MRVAGGFCTRGGRKSYASVLLFRVYCFVSGVGRPCLGLVQRVRDLHEAVSTCVTGTNHAQASSFTKVEVEGFPLKAYTSGDFFPDAAGLRASLRDNYGQASPYAPIPKFYSLSTGLWPVTFDIPELNPKPSPVTRPPCRHLGPISYLSFSVALVRCLSRFLSIVSSLS